MEGYIFFGHPIRVQVADTFNVAIVLEASESRKGHLHVFKYPLDAFCGFDFNDLAEFLDFGQSLWDLGIFKTARS